METEILEIPGRDLIRRIAERHGARNVRIIGSVARGNAGPDSDLDLLVEVGPKTSPWFPGGWSPIWKQPLAGPVDVVTERGLAAELRDRVLAEAIEV